jgi:hypothetical protein
MKYSLIAALAAAALAAACTHAVDTSGVASFGQASGNNADRQVTPAAADTTPPEGSGSQGALAQSRYRTGTTKPLLPSSSSIANPTTN